MNDKLRSKNHEFDLFIKFYSYFIYRENDDRKLDEIKDKIERDVIIKRARIAREIVICGYVLMVLAFIIVITLPYFGLPLTFNKSYGLKQTIAAANLLSLRYC